MPPGTGPTVTSLHARVPEGCAEEHQVAEIEELAAAGRAGEYRRGSTPPTVLGSSVVLPHRGAPPVRLATGRVRAALPCRTTDELRSMRIETTGEGG
nr:unnamed protein product [Digitaria exilis]